MQFRLLQRAELSRYTFDSHLSSLNAHLSAKITGNLQCCLIIPAWGISPKMRNAVGKSRSNDRTLRKTLRHRHPQRRHITVPSARSAYKLKTSIHRLAYLLNRPLPRGSRLLRCERRICIWRAIFQTIQTRLTASFTHAECNEIALCCATAI